VWLLSAAYMGCYLKRGWVPHDEGAFAQSAQRILNGDLPHRDYDEIYTGGLAYLHAFAFRLVGTTLASMRYVLFGFFLAWVPFIFYVASRFVSDLVAGAITLLCVVWSVPNYSAAVPSWYNLFFAVFGMAALLRYLESGFWRWLFVAGICGGLSILVKITGLYYVAAIILFLLFREQSITSAGSQESRERDRFYSAALLIGLSLFVWKITALIHKLPGVAELACFVLPILGLVVLLLRREFAGVGGRSSRRLAAFLKMFAPFAVGAAAPVFLFMIPYFLSGSVHFLFNGTFILPARRLGHAIMFAPDLVTLIPILPVVLLILFAYRSSGSGRVFWGVFAALGFGAILVASAKSQLIYKFGWFQLANAITLGVPAGAAILSVSHVFPKLTPLRQQQIMLLLSVAALSNLVRFPFSANIYFCYVAPLAILAGATLFASTDRPPRFILGALVGFLICFAVLRIAPVFIYDLGNVYETDKQTQPLALPRAGAIRIDANDARIYGSMIPLVQKHAVGEFIYATPDCPEIYFLSGLKNPTRTLFEFLDEPGNREDRVLDSIERHNVHVVVIQNWQGFSGDIDRDLRDELEDRFPYSEEIDRFEVRWRQ
ncbi:MAG: hypothetical protein WBP79_15995, partial [Candidatus Acidiferrales bacterium]